MNAYDEELQRNIEAGKNPGPDGIDARAYRKIFRVLKKEPDYELPPHFADRVVSRIAFEQNKKSLARDYFWFAAGIFLLVISLVATILFTGFRLDFGFLNGMADYKGLVIFGTVFIAFLHWVDKRLVRPREA